MGGREQGEVREQEGGRERGREKGSERWRKGARGGREEAMMIGSGGRERARKGRAEAWKARGQEGIEEASGGGTEGGMEQLREQGREGNFKVGILMRALARCIIGNPGEVR